MALAVPYFVSCPTTGSCRDDVWGGIAVGVGAAPTVCGASPSLALAVVHWRVRRLCSSGNRWRLPAGADSCRRKGLRNEFV